VRGCACRGTMGLAHLSCLVRQAETSVKELEECNTGEGFHKWHGCFDCGQEFHGPVFLALGWACWRTYVSPSETGESRCNAMMVLGNALRLGERASEALPVFEAHLALVRRHYSGEEEPLLGAQGNVASCLDDLGREAEALVLQREIYARWAARGISQKHTILSGYNLAVTLLKVGFWDECKTSVRDQLLPAARQTLGSDDDVTLALSRILADALAGDPESTRDDLRLNHTDPCVDRFLTLTQAMTC